MIKQLIIIFSIASSLSLHATGMLQPAASIKCAAHDMQSYVLKISPPSTLHETITDSCSFCGFYKGYQLVFERNICVINHPTKTDQFVLIITRQTKTQSRDNNTKYLERIKDEPCKLFHLTKKLAEQGQDSATWLIEEVPAQEIPLRIPADSLVIFMDPNLIESVSAEGTNNLDHEIICLPTIKLKSTVTSQALKEAATHSVFASMETDAVCPITQKKENVPVCLKHCQR